MLLHSIIPTDIILDWQKKPMEKTIEFNMGGTIVEVFEVEGNKYKIKRIISTSPSAYLNANIKPDSEFKISLGQ